MSSQYRLERIDPKKIDFSKFNPRGETQAQIESDPEFEQLKESVYKYGVLVPVVVHVQKSGKRYRLVDGERRVRAALATKVDLIPAHIASGSEGLDDLVQAFHIHMLRKQWKAVAQATALKGIIKELKAQGKYANAEDLLEELQLSTGCTEKHLKDLRRAIKYPTSTLNAVDAGKLKFSHLVQIEESFIEALNQKFPNLLKEIGERRARQVLVDKAEQKTLSSTRALMENVLPVISRASSDAERAFVEQLMKDFIEDIGMTAEQVLKKYEDKFPTSNESWAETGRTLIDVAALLGQLLDSINRTVLLEYPQLTDELSEELRQLQKKLDRGLRLFEKK